jgi:hypothetical protein
LLHALGYQVQADWQQIAGLGVQPGCSGLYVPNPVVTVSGWLAFLLRISQPVFWLGLLSGRYRPVPDLGRSTRCIPVQAFVSHWEDSDLAREIARHLPADPLKPL